MIKTGAFVFMVLTLPLPADLYVNNCAPIRFQCLDLTLNEKKLFQVCTLTVKTEVLMNMHVKKTLWLNLQLYKEKKLQNLGDLGNPSIR